MLRCTLCHGEVPLHDVVVLRADGSCSCRHCYGHQSETSLRLPTPLRRQRIAVPAERQAASPTPARRSTRTFTMLHPPAANPRRADRPVHQRGWHSRPAAHHRDRPARRQPLRKRSTLKRQPSASDTSAPLAQRVKGTAMLRPYLLLTSLVLGLAVSATALFSAAPTHADEPAYYLVVQHDTDSTSSQTMVLGSGQSSISTLQLSGSTSEVSCSRYASSEEAEAAAADRYAGQNVQVVLAVDALHALAQVAGIADDLVALLPPLTDSDLCTP